MKSSAKQRKQFSSSKNGRGIRGQLILWFTAFALLLLIIVWIFQVLLLDSFYEFTKLSELRSVVDTIEYSIGDADFDGICSELASKYDICLIVYSVKNGEINERIVDKEVSPTCVIHYAKPSDLNDYYAEALAAGDVYIQKYDLKPVPSAEQKDPIQKGHPNRHDIIPHQLRDTDFSEIAVSVKAVNDLKGNEYAVFINLRFTPVNAIQQTRNIQFLYIAFGIILAAIAFALMFSIKIAGPLERMTRAAEQMANGDYSVEFNCEGYRETRRLARTLNYAVEQISKTDNLQRELIANISHDLRTPLTLISGYSEMMRDIPDENTPENSQIIIDETKRLTTLVNDMLDYSKYSSGFEMPAFSVFNLTESVRATMTRYNELIRTNGYVIDFIFDRDVRVVADERMILQVIYNLLNNAVNYTGEDKKVQITQTVSPNGGVRISVYDSGEGIPQDKLTDIWDRYYKVDKSHKRAISGSGLGLSIVSKLLQLHSASYGVESEEGVGSCFWFELKMYE